MWRGRRAFEEQVTSALAVLIAQNEAILEREEKIMAEIDDLNTAIANLDAAVQAASAKIDVLKNAPPTGVDPAAVAAAAQQIQQAADTLNAASA